ncbi:carbonic anhydrase family protein [Microbacterium sp. KSW2-21]|uniref:carbonic anhydrase n=1 Tax=Microbacterium algihabitans TaxID=3075992 RepID=A0ABU3S152_9MICO|nr:carbonic anhydrase family protein [Microbacterium sp. KSW2-21]MDU0328433.1 carbonic anhydrase family protein [Microbacterium sp. KSW2-21]
MSRSTRLPLAALAAAGALLLGGCAAIIEPEPQSPAAADPHWSYEGASGPVGWGALDPGFADCATGTRQSPIDLPTSITATGSPIDVTAQPSEGELEDTGHTVQLSDEGDGSLVTYDGSTYELAQMHVHTPSEHTVDGVAAAAEFHFVHQNEAGDRLVIGVLAEQGAASAAYASFAVGAAEAAEAGAEADLDLDVAALLPRSLEHFAYEGSLTTPPCTENVQWIVLTTPITLSAEQLDDLDAAHPGNTRPTQLLGDRVITRGSGTLESD